MSDFVRDVGGHATRVPVPPVQAGDVGLCVHIEDLVCDGGCVAMLVLRNQRNKYESMACLGLSWGVGGI